MSEEAKKDVNQRLRTVSYGGFVVSEKGFDQLDESAKRISTNISKKEQDQEDSEESNIESNDPVRQGTEVTEDAVSDEVYENESYSNDIGNEQNSDEYTIRLNHEFSNTEGEYVSKIRTNIFNENNTVKDDLADEFEDKFSGYESTTEYTEYEVADEAGGQKLKTFTKKALHIANKATFDFHEDQGAISRVATVAGKLGKAASKAGKRIIKTSASLSKAMDNQDGAGSAYFNEKASSVTKRKASKYSGKAFLKVLQGIINSASKIVTSIASKAIVASVLGLEVLPLFAVVVAATVAVTSIFGSGASNNVIKKYSAIMTAVQNDFNQEVDDFMKKYPDGIVVGVNGGYGKIDWKVPLSIIQGSGASIDFDNAEGELLDQFKNANLLEKHTITTQKIIEKDDKGKEVIKTIHILTITNPGYDDYMSWSKDNFKHIKTFLRDKEILKKGQTYFTKEQLDVINSLNDSDSFFDAFGEDLKNHNTSTGSNKVDKNFAAPEYNEKNIFTQSGFKGQCTWYAYGRALQVTKKKMPSGDAQTWLSSASAMGYPTGSRPSVNAVVVLSGGNFGHVAFVEAWDGKKIRVSEGNYRNPYYNDTNMMVAYARTHAEELVHEETYNSYEEYKKRQADIGLVVVGFIYEK